MARDISYLEMMKSRNNILSRAYGRDSDNSGGEDNKRKFSNEQAEAAGIWQYEGMVPQPNEWRGAQIYEKCQRVWPSTFNGEDETAKAITELKPQLEIGYLETRHLSCVHCKGQIVRKHDYEEEPGHSMNIDRFRCSETDDQEKAERYFEAGSQKIYNHGGGEDDNKASSWPREHMFEKTVTPSDVGKLNRLMIPKQQAEKYFPLDTEANEKGLLLNFEDGTGKAWRFRYSYWNSSQSYVLTKGWSRFVKEKKLDAGDIVSFDRAIYQDPNLQRLFIGCKRKPFSTAQPLGLLGSVNRPLKLSGPSQILSNAIDNIGVSHDQQLISSRALIGPQWMPLFCPENNLNNVGGESSRGALKARALQMTAQPMDLCFVTREEKPSKGIDDLVIPFSIQRSSGSQAMDTENSMRETALHAMQSKDLGSSGNDRSWPVKNKLEATAKCFDHSDSISTFSPTAKKVVRLFGVDLECGKVDGSYKDELHIIPPSDSRFP